MQISDKAKDFESENIRELMTLLSKEELDFCKMRHFLDIVQKKIEVFQIFVIGL